MLIPISHLPGVENHTLLRLSPPPLPLRTNAPVFVHILFPLPPQPLITPNIYEFYIKKKILRPSAVGNKRIFLFATNFFLGRRFAAALLPRLFLIIGKNEIRIMQ